MTTNQLKEKLINKINVLNDNNILEDIYRIIETEEDQTGIYKLNDEQINAIDEARSQIKDGNFYTDDEAEKDIGKWLNE